MKYKNDLTQDYLKRILDYNPETGEFRWKSRTSNRIKIGDILSSKDGKGYIRTRIYGQSFSLHRLAFLYMQGRWPENEVDHINCIRDDNRWENLREATRNENEHNKKKYKTNTSGYKGVYWDKSRGKWFSYTRVNGVMKALGRFDCLELATFVAEEARRKYHGNFSNG